MRCINCGTELEEGSVFCHCCGVRLPASQIATVDTVSDISELHATPVAPATAKKRKRSKLKIALASIAAVLVVVIVVGLCTNWFGFYGPGTRIALAAKNTIEEGNFTLTIDGDQEFIIQFDIDFENRTLAYFQEYESSSSYSGEKYTYYTAVYDEYYVYGTIYDDGETHLWKYDISDELDDFFDDYEEAKDWDWEDLFDLLDDQTGDDLDEYLDEDEFETCCKRYLRKLNNNNWLKENAGYSKSRENGITYYHFEPDAYDFLSASLDMFESAFIDDDDFDDLKDELKGEKRELKDYDLEFSIGIKSRKLAEIIVEDDGDEFTMEFTDYGTTSIDEDLLADLLSKAKLN